MNALGLTLKQDGHYDKAIDIYGKSLGIQRRALGARHHECLATMHNMAECFRASGDDSKVRIDEVNVEI